MEINTGRDMTKLMQGIAILFMILHHFPVDGLLNHPEPLVTNPFMLAVMADMKICVGIFTFFIGFGYGYTKEKTYRTSFYRIWRFLKKWWALLFLIFLPSALIVGIYKFSLPEFIYEMFGMQEELNWYSWYVYVYIFALLLFPLVHPLIDRKPLLWTLALAFVGLLVEVAVHTIPGWAETPILHSIFSFFLYWPVLLAGYYCSSTNFFSKLAKCIKSGPMLYTLSGGGYHFVISRPCLLRQHPRIQP